MMREGKSKRVKFFFCQVEELRKSYQVVVDGEGEDFRTKYADVIGLLLVDLMKGFKRMDYCNSDFVS